MGPRLGNGISPCFFTFWRGGIWQAILKSFCFLEKFFCFLYYHAIHAIPPTQHTTLAQHTHIYVYISSHVHTHMYIHTCINMQYTQSLTHTTHNTCTTYTHVRTHAHTTGAHAHNIYTTQHTHIHNPISRHTCLLTDRNTMASLMKPMAHAVSGLLALLAGLVPRPTLFSVARRMRKAWYLFSHAWHQGRSVVELSSEQQKELRYLVTHHIYLACGEQLSYTLSVELVGSNCHTH